MISLEQNSFQTSTIGRLTYTRKLDFSANIIIFSRLNSNKSRMDILFIMKEITCLKEFTIMGHLIITIKKLNSWRQAYIYSKENVTQMTFIKMIVDALIF